MAATMSLSSRPPSIRSQAPTAISPTPPLKAAQSAQLPQVNSSTFKHKLKHMFDSSPSATFSAQVTIHELGNVPQLDGQFAVKWKFRGRRPHDADRMLEHPRQRQTVESRATNSPSLRNSSSLMSLRSAATGSTTASGTSTPSGAWAGRAQTHVSHHAATLPNPSQSSVSISHMDAQHREKKTTDPTPLRQSTKPDEFRDERLIVDEPQGMYGTATPDQVSTYDTTLPVSESSTSMSTAGGSSTTTTTTAGGMTTTSTTSAAGTSTTTMPSSSTASIPTEGSRSIPSVRSGRISHNFGPHSKASSIMSTDSTRVPSRASSRSDHSIPSVVVSSHGRSATYPYLDSHTESNDRKGRTPIRAIRSHAVAWEYTIGHVIRVPLGKHVEVAQSSRHHKGGSNKQTLPILGGGPLSDSGLRLDIEQVDQRGEGMKTSAGQDVLFGYVNIDLAPFADLGPVTRKFLLKDSKTNATIRVTIVMQYIGGEQDWVAPQMAEGHLVQGISELTGEDSMPLLPTASISSNSDKSTNSGLAFSRSTPSVNKVSPSISVAATAKHRYRSYEHHLLPEATKKDREQRRPAPPTSHPRSASSPHSSAGRSSSPSFGYSLSSWPSPPSPSPPADESPKFFTRKDGMLTASPQSSPGLLPSSSPPRTSFSAFGSGLSPVTSPEFGINLSPVVSRTSVLSRLSPITTHLESPDSSLAGRHGSVLSPDLTPMSAVLHHHHSRFLRDRDDAEQGELQPDMVIESVFNPKPADENSPFTYVSDSLEEEQPEPELDFAPRLTRATRLDPDATLPLPSHAPHSHWKSLIRRRVVSTPHKCS